VHGAEMTKPWAHFADQTRFSFYIFIPYSAFSRSRRTWLRFPRVIISPTYQYQHGNAVVAGEIYIANGFRALACIYSQLAPNYKLVSIHFQQIGEASDPWSS